MIRSNFIISAIVCLAISTSGYAARKTESAAVADGPPRGLKIVVAQDAAAPIQEAAKEIAEGVNASPLLQIMSGGKSATIVNSGDLAKAPAADRAFNYLILVGLPDDPIIQQAWLRDARVIGSGSATGLYVFGYGNLMGDIGYVESDRNPFLHGIAIKQAPYETEIVTVSGSTAAGVKLAADAFLRDGLINGVVASNWKRGDTTLLDRDPLKPGSLAVDGLPLAVGNWKRIGITEIGEDEYRGVLADTGVEPQMIWRGKYYSPGVWDGGGAAHSMQDFNDGLHRRSYGDTIWAANFGSPAEATQAAAKIATAAHLKKDGKGYSGKLGPLGSEKESAGPLKLELHDSWVIMSTVPA